MVTRYVHPLPNSKDARGAGCSWCWTVRRGDLVRGQVDSGKETTE